MFFMHKLVKEFLEEFEEVPITTRSPQFGSSTDMMLLFGG
jgi:hypothetical protein